MTEGANLRRGRRLGVALVLSALALGACGRSERDGDVASGEWSPSGSDVKNVQAAALATALRTRLEADQRPPKTDAGSWRRMDVLYASYADRPFWLEDDGFNARAAALLAALADAENDALSLDAYPLAELHRAMTAVDDERRPSAEQLAEAELLLSSVYVALTEDLLTGQLDPSQISQAWHIEPLQSDVDSALARSFRQGDLARSLASLRPQSDDYALLRRELARYRQLVDAGGWSAVPGGATLKPGDPADPARMQALAARLHAEGYLDDPTAPTATPVALRQSPRGAAARAPDSAAVYDPQLAGAVAAFQARHNIVVDSVLGGETLESLNLPADYRLGQIAANLERQRWLPHSLGSRYIYVNVPAFELHAFDGGKEALNMRVVVGAEYNDQDTPAFADSMSYVVFRPYWNVPENIAEEEIWPKVAADPGYLASRHYEVVEENGERRIRQTPGDHNALGLAKFMFPNDFAIYLHDTPESELFERDVRALSHGCIRVEDPAALANFVLGWDRTRIEQAMQSGRDNQEVALERKLPVYIVYFTTYGRDGQLFFGNDLYQRDGALVSRVASAARVSPQAKQVLEKMREIVE